MCAITVLVIEDFLTKVEYCDLGCMGNNKVKMVICDYDFYFF
jgi:hypothetical protein